MARRGLHYWLVLPGFFCLLPVSGWAQIRCALPELARTTQVFQGKLIEIRELPLTRNSAHHPLGQDHPAAFIGFRFPKDPMISAVPIGHAYLVASHVRIEGRNFNHPLADIVPKNILSEGIILEIEGLPPEKARDLAKSILGEKRKLRFPLDCIHDACRQVHDGTGLKVVNHAGKTPLRPSQLFAMMVKNGFVDAQGNHYPVRVYITRPDIQLEDVVGALEGNEMGQLGFYGGGGLLVGGLALASLLQSLF